MTDNTFDLIKSVILKCFEAPDHFVEVWINENMKSLIEVNKDNKNLLSIADETIIYDTIGIYFCKKPWPIQNRSSFLRELSKKSLFYNWRLL